MMETFTTYTTQSQIIYFNTSITVLPIPIIIPCSDCGNKEIIIGEGEGMEKKGLRVNAGQKSCGVG